MEKQTKTFTSSLLTLDNRKTLNLTGVEKVYGANETKVNLRVAGSQLCISGNSLSIDKLDVDSGSLTINGIVDEIKYSKARGNESLFKRIFK